MSWIPEPPLPGPRAMFAVATGAAPAPGSGTRIYAIGGADSSGNPTPTIAYDTQAHSWSPVADMPTPRGCLATASTPGRVHALAGFTGTGTLYVATHEIYEPATDIWSTARPVPTARSWLAAATGPNGLIYALGGWKGSSQVLAVVEAYDPASDNWFTKAPMPTPRAGLAAVTAGGRIYALGGGDNHNVFKTVEIYDPATDTWTSGPPLPSPRTGLGAAVGPDGRIYAIGGNDDTGTTSASLFSLDPATPAAGWAQGDLMSTERALLGVATGPDGLVYAIGGYNTGTNSALDTVEAFNPYGLDQSVLDDLKKMGIVGTLIGGVDRGAGGGIVIGKHFIPIPPRSPVMASILGAAAPYLRGATENAQLGQLIANLRPNEALH
jgi:Kelch motif